DAPDGLPSRVSSYSEPISRLQSCAALLPARDFPASASPRSREPRQVLRPLTAAQPAARSDTALRGLPARAYASSAPGVEEGVVLCAAGGRSATVEAVPEAVPGLSLPPEQAAVASSVPVARAAARTRRGRVAARRPAGGRATAGRGADAPVPVARDGRTAGRGVVTSAS